MPQKKKCFQLESPTACVFCGKDEDNEFLFGKFFRRKTLSVHQNCMFFASGLSQRGKKESEGILGFLISDIQKEVLRGKKLNCFHCKRKGATVGCCKSICRRTFHFPCGLKNQSLHQFFGSFSSFCQLHRPVQKPIKIPEEELYCHICFLSLPEKDLNSCLYSTCCNRNFFHRTCLQKYALSAGRYFFKCPLCNNSSDFMNEMEFYGICVPEKDASWELEENAYEDLLYRPECGAADCLFIGGKKYNGKSAEVLLSCSNCGADARHRSCANLDDDETTWTCNECKTLEDQILKKRMNLQNASEITEGAKCLDSVNQQVPIVEMQSNVSEPSCSNLYSNATPSLISKTENLVSDSVGVSTDECDEAIVCEEIPSAVVSPFKVPPVANTRVKSKTKKRANCINLKREIASEDPNSNKKICFVNGAFNRVKTEIMQQKPTFILNCNSIKKSTSKRQSIVVLKKRKSDKKFNSGCCSGNSQQCIKKMFGLQCHNYRI
ncbi:PHD finger protein 7-like [Argiope bruennichi]|uniref:PHD finger protein 7-like n=1 Tax=Argiope bruennichi TaxID=94029 RepID=UPI0024941D3E|nr:PHD finger protein 7-like [Argiope bruennichi]